MSPLGRVSIVGAGQIGTTIGRALGRAEPRWGVETVELYDRDPDVVRRALRQGGADRAGPGLAPALDADVVVLAIPVDEILAWLEDNAQGLRPGTLLVDTGSAKREVVRAMARWVAPEVLAIGGHPVAGNESSGPEAADPELLQGAVFALTPVRRDPLAELRARELVEALGARPLVVDASRHDRVMARTSHLPHLLAAALVGVASRLLEEQGPARELVGPGFRGATRLAASDPGLVASFLCANIAELSQALRELGQELDRLGQALGAGSAVVEAALAQSQAARVLLAGPA
ncbi:MAG: prephenate dehydrogenase [Candidatus Dormibacteria bacterium]